MIVSDLFKHPTVCLKHNAVRFAWKKILTIFVQKFKRVMSQIEIFDM